MYSIVFNLIIISYISYHLLFRVFRIILVYFQQQQQQKVFENISCARDHRKKPFVLWTPNGEYCKPQTYWYILRSVMSSAWNGKSCVKEKEPAKNIAYGWNCIFSLQMKLHLLFLLTYLCEVGDSLGSLWKDYNQAFRFYYRFQFHSV